MKALSLALFLFILSVSTVESATIPPGATDDAYLGLTYVGSWTDVTDGVSYGGSHKMTTDFSASLSFEIYAEDFTYHFLSDPLAGSVDVCVDATCTTVSHTGTAGRGSQAFTALGAGLKSIVISKTTDDATSVTVDAVYIYPEQIQLEVQQPEYINLSTISVSGTDYTVATDLRVTSGDVAIFLMLVFIACISLFHFIYRMANR
jgi:hypothetical protein